MSCDYQINPHATAQGKVFRANGEAAGGTISTESIPTQGDKAKSTAWTHEPQPKGHGDDVLTRVILDLKARGVVGKLKYGTALKTNNGRNALMDAYQEALDMCMYLKQKLMEETKPMKTIREWQHACHENAINHGWWEEKRPIPELLCLVHSEVSEALEAYRKADMVGFREEMADIAIRLLDLAEAYGVDLEREIAAKHEKNILRPYRHGGKVC